MTLIEFINIQISSSYHIPNVCSSCNEKENVLEPNLQTKSKILTAELLPSKTFIKIGTSNKMGIMGY